MSKNARVEPAAGDRTARQMAVRYRKGRPHRSARNRQNQVRDGAPSEIEAPACGLVDTARGTSSLQSASRRPATPRPRRRICASSPNSPCGGTVLRRPVAAQQALDVVACLRRGRGRSETNRAPRRRNDARPGPLPRASRPRRSGGGGGGGSSKEVLTVTRVLPALPSAR